MAARNLLIDEHTLKVVVADFGMSQELPEFEQIQSVVEKGPVRWMAPESLLKHW